MDFIKWDDSYSVGVEKIDSQHRLLMKLLNDFLKEINQAGKEEMEALTKALLNYSGHHFDMEEEFLKRHPNIDFHKSEHQKFVNRILSLREDLDNGKNISGDMASFLVSWLNDHILKTDKAFFSGIDEAETG